MGDPPPEEGPPRTTLTPEERGFARALRSLQPDIAVREVARRVHDTYRKPKNLRGPGPDAIGRLFSDETFQTDAVRTGRPPDTTKREDSRLPAVVEKLEDENRDRNVVARMINVRWNTKKKISDATVSRKLRKQKRGWKRCLRKIPVDKVNKAICKAWGKKHRRHSVAWWQTGVLAIDCCSFKWYTSPKGKAAAASMKKTGSYRLASEGRKRAAPSPFKHRQGAKCVHICGGFGAGATRLWAEYGRKEDGDDDEKRGGGWCGDTYCRIVRYHLTQAVKVNGGKNQLGGHNLTVLRDNDPKGFNSNKGRAKEEACGLEVLPLPTYRPDLSPPDYTFWNEINEQMKKDEAAWPEGKRETFDEFRARLKATALGLSKEVVDAGMRSMHRRCRQLDESGGEWTKDD